MLLFGNANMRDIQLILYKNEHILSMEILLSIDNKTNCFAADSIIGR